MSQFIETTELDFLNYRNSLKEYLKNQQSFKDYDFEGSNMAVLLDILALNTLNNAYYENMIGSEVFLDTAQLKDSVVSKAKDLNYTPRSRTASRTTVSISIDTNGNNPSSIIIPKYYNITAIGSDSENNIKSYNFVTNNSIIVQADALNNYVADDVEIYQGLVAREVFVVDGTSRYVLQSNKVDISSIEVFVQTSNTNTFTEKYERALDIYGLNDTSKIFFVQAYNDDRYEIQFGNGIIGKSVSNGNIIKVNYIVTDGEIGNGISDFKPTVAIEGYAVSSIISDNKTYGGSERESIKSIKFNAPRHFATQERAVIESDFETLVREKFPTVQSIKAYGGERLNPPQYGRVALFVKPFGLEGIISNSLKNDIINYVGSKTLTTQPFIVDPEYFYVSVNSKVYYNLSKITKTLEQLKTNVITSIYNYGQETLTEFDSDLRFSKILKIIDSVDDSIVSNDTNISLIKRWSPNTGSMVKYSFSFGAKLQQYGNSKELESGIASTFNSSIFSYVLNGISYSAKIEDNGIGILKVIANNSTKTVLNSNVGSINYETGEVNLSINISTYDGYISLYANTKNKDLIVSENRFLILDSADINVILEKAAE